MKKFSTLLLVAMTAIIARATDYDVPLKVTVNGVSTEQKSVFSVNENDGLYDITLKNFTLQSADAPMPVGNVAIQGIKPYREGNTTLLIANNTVSITPGDDPNVTFWMASLLPPVNIDLRGKIEGEQLRCYIDIDLTESMGQVIQVAIGDGYQIANQSFENWHASAEGFMEPNAWHSFESATGAFAALAGHHIDKSDDAHSGKASARIFATSIFGIIANGTMTTGRMNADAMSATDPANHAYLDMSMLDVDGNGDPFYTLMYTVPDSIAAWVKFSQGTPNSAHPYATLSAVVTDGTRYQDPEDKEYTNIAAKAKNSEIAVTGGQWVRVTAPFVSTGNDVTPKAILVTASTNADGGQGSGDDEMLIDDIEFIYNAKVTGIKIKGQDVPGFASDNMSYEMEVNEEITADDIEVTVNGKTAHVVKTVEAEGDHYLCTVRAISADMSAMTTYLIQVKSNASAISSLKSVDGKQATYFTLDGRQVTTLVPGRIYICRQADGSTVKIRR